MNSEKTKTAIIIGDNRRMEELEDESEHLIITSPPYWQLKDYGNGSQIGFNDTWDAIILLCAISQLGERHCGKQHWTHSPVFPKEDQLCRSELQ